MNFFRTLFLMSSFLCFLSPLQAQKTARFPWDNGKLKVTDNHRFLQHENGTPFFWLGDTGWLASSRLTRDGMDYYFKSCKNAGFNVVQVSVLHDIPFYNVYGKPALPYGFDFRKVGVSPEYGYWDHLDYMVESAAKQGIYIAIVCVWGGPVNAGKMSEQDAAKYGTFLANRYKDKPNIIWVIGGDTRGDKKTEVWQALAHSIRTVDGNHLMTYHPRGRTCSAEWFHNEAWLDFDMFQSGHRRYGQTSGDGEKTIEPENNEDNWRFVEKVYTLPNPKPVLDGEPSYEDIPAGLHDGNEPRWQPQDVRRYAYWSVFAGSFGHTYGHNSIMQMLTPGVTPSYFTEKPWYDALKDPGYNQMQYLKNLMRVLPFTEGMPDQRVIAGDAGSKHDRLIANRGKDYALVYDYTGKEVKIDLSQISGVQKNIWWYNPVDGGLQFVETTTSGVKSYFPEGGYRSGNDKVLIAVDASKDYLKKDWTKIPAL
jgi:hypothetical protein